LINVGDLIKILLEVGLRQHVVVEVAV